MQEVNWDAVNLLEFQIADGRIKSIEVKLLS